MKVLYICFTGFDNINRGSAVRPYKMYKAFIKKGYDVFLINGDANARSRMFAEFKKSNRYADIDYCYIEPSTYPCHPKDYLMFFYLKFCKFPIGIFYRDMYFKFPELFNKQGVKKLELLLRYKIDWFFYKLISKTIFFPSDSMAKYFNFVSKVALPPAGEELNINKGSINNSVIYVGGISKEFGTDILLEAMELVNMVKSIKLILVCREYDRQLFDKYNNCSWLEVVHLSGDELSQVYEKSDIAIIPRPITEYNNFAVPIKLFEYLSYAMPIVSTNCFETAEFIKKNEIGIIVNDNSQDIADAILGIYENPRIILDYVENIKNVLVSENLWEHRIDKIENHLFKKSSR